jgi:hypothetical protein
MTTQDAADFEAVLARLTPPAARTIRRLAGSDTDEELVDGKWVPLEVDMWWTAAEDLAEMFSQPKPPAPAPIPPGTDNPATTAPAHGFR